MKGQMGFRRCLPFLLPLFSLLPVGLLYFMRKPAQMWILQYYQARQQDPILLELETGYAINRLLYAFIFCLPLAYALTYAVTLLLAKLWARFLTRKADSASGDEAGCPPRQDVLPAQKIQRIAHVLFAVCLAAVILSSKQMLYASYAGPAQNVRVTRDAFQRDLANYRAGKLTTYQGPLAVDGYIASDPDKPSTGNGYYAFSTDSKNHLWLRCPKECFSGTQFLMPSYEAKFLPSTLYVVSIVGPDGRERLGADSQQVLQPGQWTYGDVVLKKSSDILGYHVLNKEQQRLFDLMNSGILLENLLQRKQGVYAIRLDERLTEDEFRKVSRLYRRTHAIEMENFPLYGYYLEKGTQGEAALLHITGKDYGWRVCRLYGPIFRQRAREIAGSLTDSGADEKCRQITDYLLNHVSSVQKPDGPPENEWALFPDTGFGALINGAGNSKGYALAFDAIARYAGLTVQLMEKDAENEEQDSQFWNTVRLENGQWLKIDVHTLALEKKFGQSAARPAGQVSNRLAATRSAGNSKFGYVRVPATWDEFSANEGSELIYRQPGGKSQIGFRKLESAGAFSPAAAARNIRADIEAQAGVVYTDFSEYLSPDCPSHLLCAAFPDGLFLITWIYPGADGKGCSLSVYGTSENIMDLYTIAKQTFSMENPK